MQAAKQLYVVFFFVLLSFACFILYFPSYQSYNCKGKVNLVGQDVVARGCSSASDLRIMVCTLFKSVATKDIQEWIEYHRWIGIEYFYLREHESTNTKDDLKYYIEQGIVGYSYTNMDRSQEPQGRLFQECIDHFRDQYDFIAFLDSDEYIVMQQPGLCFNSFLENYTDYGALAINWIQMGSSGHIQRPPGATLLNYINCDLNKTLGFNKYIKSVVNTKYVTEQLNVHIFYMKDDKITVNEHFMGVHGHEIPEGATWDFVGLQHYQTKSFEDFNKRSKRGGAGYFDPHLEYDTLDQHATSFCFNAQRIALECCSKFYVQGY